MKKSRVTRKAPRVTTKAAPCLQPGRDWRVTSCLCLCHYGEPNCA